TSPSVTAAGPLRWGGRGWESRSNPGPSKVWSRNGVRSAMTEPGMDHRSFEASDGYPFHVGLWPAAPPIKGSVVVLHGVQSHSGWYHSLGRSLATAGYQASFPDRRGSGPNLRDRGHAPSGRRLVRDIAEWLKSLRDQQPSLPIVLAGISWGAKLVLIAAARYPELVDGIALICPGLLPRVGVSRQ